MPLMKVLRCKSGLEPKAECRLLSPFGTVQDCPSTRACDTVEYSEVKEDESN